MPAKVFGLFRYPIKGLSSEPLKSFTLQAGRGVCGEMHTRPSQRAGSIACAGQSESHGERA